MSSGGQRELSRLEETLMVVAGKEFIDFFFLFFASAVVNLVVGAGGLSRGYRSGAGDAGITGLVKHSGCVYRGRLVCNLRRTVGGER